jgi:membrane-associated tyrosine/threonine-specific cdc2-inhibitory kinase
MKEGDAKYVAPELIMGGIKQFTQKADIFSLGISVLEMAGNLDLPTCGPVWVALRENKFPFAQTKRKCLSAVSFSN